jgi:GNAT superfamily N-acetyltransferase
MIIVPASFAHLRDVNRIFKKTMGMVDQKLRHQALAYQRGVFVAIERGEVIGFYVAWKKGSHTVWLDYLGVRRDAQGRGIGRALMEHCEEQAMRSGAATLDLSVLATNRKVIPFYESLGYVKTAEVSETDPAIHFSKQLVTLPVDDTEIFGGYSRRRPLEALRILLFSTTLRVFDRLEQAA